MPHPAIAGSARNNTNKRDKKERTKKKRIGAKAVDARMGEEEKNRKQEEKMKETGSGPPIQLPWTILVASYDPHGSYGGPSLKTPAQV